jgi:hypothetical protein
MKTIATADIRLRNGRVAHGGRIEHRPLLHGAGDETLAGEPPAHAEHQRRRLFQRAALAARTGGAADVK